MIEEKTKFGDSIVYLKFLNKEQYEQLGEPAPSSVHCFPIMNNEILFTVNQRGLDIIGGHVEKGETAQEAMIREANEEACIMPTQYRIIGAIEVDNRDAPESVAKGYPLKGYQLFYEVTEFETKPFKQDFESTTREYVKAQDISSRHHKWLNVHEQLVNQLNIVPLKNKFKK